MLSRALCVALALSIGCGSSARLSPDGDPDAGTADSGLAIAAPAAPAAAVMAPCPAGWSEIAASRASAPARCEPWPEGRPTCGAGEAAFPGDIACAPVGGACPEGDFASDLPTTGSVLYVRAGALPGGTGTGASPFARIQDAIDRAGAGATIAIAKGTYDEAIAIPGGLTLWGACAAQTRIEASTYSATRGTVFVATGAATLRGVTIAGERPGVWAQGTAALTVEGVVIDGALGGGVLAWAGAVNGHDLVVRGTRTDPAIVGSGLGLSAADGAQIELSRAAIEGTHGAALRADGAGTRVALDGFAIVDGRADAGAQSGLGALDYDGAEIALSAGIIDHAYGWGLLVGGGTATLDHVIVRDVAPSPSDPDALALAALVREGGQLEARAVVLERAGAALLVGGIESSVHLEDVVVRAADERDGARWGAVAAQGARLEGARVWMGDGLTAALVGLDASTVVDVADLVVDGVVDQRAAGMAIDAPSAGVLSQGGADVSVHRAELRDIAWVGADAVLPGSILRLEDIAFRAMNGRALDRLWGRAMVADLGSTVEATRVVVDGAHEAAIVAAGDGGSLRLTDAVVMGTLASPCDTPGGSCESAGGGCGVVALAGASIALDHVALRAGALCGLQIARGGLDAVPGDWSDAFGAIDFVDGEVAGNPIGANVQDPGYDFARIAGPSVLYIDNDRNIDGAEMPVPAAGEDFAL